MALGDFPSDRPDTYDEDLVFNWDTGTWVSTESLLAEGGSRHRTQLVAVGKGLVYFEEIT